MKRSLLPFIILAGLLFATCGKQDNNGEDPPPLPDENAFLNIRLTDAPAGYDAVYIEILQTGAFIDDTWYDFEILNPGIYDLLSLANGNTLLMVQGAEVPSGHLSQMRLVLGENNTIVFGGETFELKTPSGQTSGYKAKIESDITGPNTFLVVIDFDAERSIVQTGNGKYNLKPVLRAYLSSETGQIAGTVSPSESGYYAMAYNSNSDTSGTLIEPGDGSFLLGGIYQGIYTVEILANEGWQDKVIPNVGVSEGNTTVLGVITLDPGK
jgi:hypothetical protein